MKTNTASHTLNHPFSLKSRYLLVGALAFGLFLLLGSHAWAAGDFSIGLDDTLETKATAAGKVIINICKVCCLGFVGYEFFMFMKKKETLSLILATVGVVGFAMAPTLVNALFTFGSK